MSGSQPRSFAVFLVIGVVLLGASGLFAWRHFTAERVAREEQARARAAQLAAGRDWLRLNLAATALGLGLHPISQALQEFPEMRASYIEAHALLAPEGGVVQMLGRIGYAAAVPPTPRWPVDTRIRAV